MADALLDKAGKTPAARRTLGLRQGIGREAARVRLLADLKGLAGFEGKLAEPPPSPEGAA